MTEITYTKDQRKVFKELKMKIKAELNNLVMSIRLGKPLRKPCVYNISIEEHKIMFGGLDHNRVTYRHAHIAYCMFFNRTPYAMIEHPRKNNKPSSYMIEDYQKNWENQLNDAISMIAAVESEEDEEAIVEAA